MAISSEIARRDAAMLGQVKHERHEGDFYPTIDTLCTKAAIRHMRRTELAAPHHVVWENAAGAGDMANVLMEHFDEVICTDIEPRMEGCGRFDFLNDQPACTPDIILTNPPFSVMDEWLERTLQYVNNFGVNAGLLVRSEVDHAKGRRRFFADSPYYHSRLALTWRPRWIAGTKGSPRHNYVWHFWSFASQGRQATNHYAFKADL